MRKLYLALAVLGSSALAVGCGKGRVNTWDAKAKTQAPAQAAAVEGDPEAEGDALWEQRDDQAQLEAALAAWELALAAKPTDVELLVKLARGSYLLSDGYFRADKERYLETFEKGVDYAERALTASSPEFEKRVRAGETVIKAVESVDAVGVPALYWYSSNLGKWAKAKGFTTLLGNKDTIKAIMERCLELDESYFYGGPHRYFGAYYAVAPSFAGGDLNKAKAHFDKSLEAAPDAVSTKVLMAENYAVKAQDRELFVKLLEEVLAVEDDIVPELVPETKIEKEKARELLAEVDENF